MLKETEETIVFFCDIFIIVELHLEPRRSRGAPPPRLRLGSKCNSLSQQSNCEHGDDLSNFQQKFALGRSFQHFAIEFLGTKKHYSHA